MFNQLYYDQFNKTYAEQVALGHLHLDGIKYIYYSQNRNYFDFYKKYNTSYALHLSERLKDLEGVKHVSAKIAKNYSDYLYNNSLTLQAQLNKAIEFRDLNWIKHVFSPHDYKQILYPTTNDTVKLEELLTYAVFDLQDIDGVMYILKQYKLLYPQTLTLVSKKELILKIAYYKQNIDIAYSLIDAGWQFDVKFIIRHTPDHLANNNLISYHNHLKILLTKNYITKAEYDQSISLLNTLNAPPIKVLQPTQIGYSMYEVLKSSTYVDKIAHNKIHTIYNSYVASSSSKVKDIVKLIAITNLVGKVIPMLLPTDGRYSDAHYSGSVITDPYSNYFICSPGNLVEVKSILHHEQGHFFLDALFNNGAKPYLLSDLSNKTSRYNAYQEAARQTLVNVLYLLKENTPPIQKKADDIAKDLKSSFVLSLNHVIYQYNKDSILDKISVDSLLTAYFNAPGIRANMQFTLKQFLNLPEAQKVDILQKIINNYALSWDQSYLLERIYDYVMRPEEQYEVELLNRLPELQIKGLDKTTLKMLEPLSKYWMQYVSPEVDKLVKEHIEECKKWIKSGTVYKNVKEYCILDIYNQNDSDNLLLNSETRCELIEAAIKSFAYDKNGQFSSIIAESNAAKELFYSSKNDKQAKCIDKIISNFNIAEKDIEKAFIESARSGYAEYINIFFKKVNIKQDTQLEALKSSINKIFKCSNSKSFKEFCDKSYNGLPLVYNTFFINKANQDIYVHTSCVIYNNIADLLSYDELENIIHKFNVELISPTPMYDDL